MTASNGRPSLGSIERCFSSCGRGGYHSSEFNLVGLPFGEPILASPARLIEASRERRRSE